MNLTNSKPPQARIRSVDATVAPHRSRAGAVHAQALIVVLGLGLGMSLADAASDPTADDYARADKFLPWNASRYVVNGDIQHHWIGNEDRLWYRRTNAAGEKEFVIVDAANGKRTPAFDQRKIAAALTKQTGQSVEAGKLPFSSFRYAQNNTAIQFQFAEKLWTCRLKTATCVAASQSAEQSEVVSPDGHYAAFLKGYDVWIRQTSGGAAFPLTTDGMEHYSYAGLAENMDTVSASRHPKPTPPQVIWSPDSRYLLTHRLDERQVKDSFLVQSVPEDGSMRPKLYTYRFAMIGDEHLPVLEPIVLDVVARRQVNLATKLGVNWAKPWIEKHDTWWSADSKNIYYLNWDRFSKSVSLYKGDPLTGAVSEVLRETSRTVVQVNGDNLFTDRPAVRTLGNGDVIWYSDRTGWGHLYYYEGATGALRHQITQGEWLVRNIIRVDEASSRIFFMASGRERGRDPYEQYLYSIQFDGSGIRLLTPEEADHVLVSAPLSDEPSLTEATKDRFSPSGQYFVDSYSRPDMPPVLVLRTADGRLIKRLEEADISALRESGYTPVEPFQVLGADGQTAIYGNILRPSTFDPRKRYPVIDSNYPGPQSIRTFKNFTWATFDYFGAQSLAELGFIVITIDGRGTPHRSKMFLDYSYGRLDKASDLEDHIAAMRQLAERYPYLDLDRVGIDGVSGGGYAAARALLAYPNFYKVAVSAEGNHDQRGYASVWGETWIGPLIGSDYLAGSNLPLAANLQGKLFLMHGELDDNVSPTLTMKLVDDLIKANKDFDLLIIPNGDHDVFLKSPYFIRRKWDYFVRNLLGAEPPAGYKIDQSP